MPGPSSSSPDSVDGHPDSLAAVGGWLFRHRTVIPLPIAIAILALPSGPRSFLQTPPYALGVPAVLLGEGIRLWAVHHIGVISRTRSERLGPLIDTGPFSLVRNPLYLGNITLWTGLALSANLAWLAPLVILLLALEYQAIVRWEEQLLTSRMGAAYRAYLARVPRWIPRLAAPARLEGAGRFSWGETLHSERGTLIAIAVGFLLLAVKAQIWAP